MDEYVFNAPKRSTCSDARKELTTKVDAGRYYLGGVLADRPECITNQCL